MEGPSASTMRRDPYEVLSVSRDSTDQEIKTAYRKLALNKLGVLIKTTISANVLEEDLNGTVTVRPLPIGKSISGKVDKQCAHFFGVTISDEQAKFGIVVRVTSTAKSKFKILHANFQGFINNSQALAMETRSWKHIKNSRGTRSSGSRDVKHR